MSNLDDFEFENENGDFETGPVASGAKKGRPWWIAAVVALLLAGGVAWWLTRGEDATPPPTPPESREPAPGERPEPPDEEPVPLPELPASDPVVRELVSRLSAHPRLAAWLATDDLIRRFTASIVNVWEGVSPRSHVAFMAPAQPFSTRRDGSRLLPSAKSYARYDAVADVVASLDIEGTVALYRRLEPLIEEAFRDLGYPDREFEEVLVASLDHLLATPVLDAEPELVEAVAAYEYADEDLEELSMGQKQLLRTGPENVAKIQSTLRQLRNELMRTPG